MATITIPGMFLTGDHASRPAASAVGKGSIYSCSTHSLIYQSDGSSWTTWATLGVGDATTHIADSSDAHDASAISVLDTATNFTGTDVEAVLAELQDNIDAVGAGAGLVSSGSVKITSGDLTLNNTSWTNTGITDITVAASTGDVVEASISGRWGNQSVTSGLDVATIVSASPVNYLGTGGSGTAFGPSGWVGNSGVLTDIGASILYTVQAGDISGGNVTFRIRYRTGSAVNKGLFASADTPFQWSVKNFGQ